MTSVSAVLVPMDDSMPLESILIPKNPKEDLEELTRNLQGSQTNTSVDDVRQKLLLRPSSNGAAGLYAFVVVPDATSSAVMDPQQSTKNIRATRLAMACGLFSYQFHFNVLLLRTSLASREDLGVDEVYGACCLSPDLRSSFQKEISIQQKQEGCPSAVVVPSWLGDALQQNYHDVAVLSKLATVMTPIADDDDENSDSNDTNEGDSSCGESQKSDSEHNSHNSPIDATADNNPNNEATPTDQNESAQGPNKKQFVTKKPLCIHCRRPASTLCVDCQACYFCNDASRNCKTMGWTHKCLCPTWKAYADRRGELARFSYLEDWTQDLTTAAFHCSEEPYEEYLKLKLGIDVNMNDSDDKINWWTTELHGWAGGNSQSAETVDISIRTSYAQGFSPLTDIPPQRPVDEKDIIRATKDGSNVIGRNSVGLLQLTCWKDYYRLRDLPPSSPVALLCTFPLTVYCGIARYGEVPCTVARMLKRPLRIHIVGVEKEANFLDLFQEVGYLLPQDFLVEITFVVREDMLPPKCRQPQDDRQTSIMMKLTLCPNLSITVVSGTYGDSLDPNFDCGTAGPPDMVMGLNAGLYAYETWRSAVTYLHHNPGIVGVFTDYNEYSGVNCASLAGHVGRQSLNINPFRQPRAMPVYSMNLPQFSNGFFYVMNAQELD